MVTEEKASQGLLSPSEQKDAQLATRISCVMIITGFIVYWWSEIQIVREMLELAYG